MEYLFYSLIILCSYSYFLYPLILKLIPPKRPGDVHTAGENGLPALSLIITVHNEEERIREKLENSLALDYEHELLEIIVASDSSTDATNSIVQSYSGKGIRLVETDEHKGKEYAQLCAIQVANGEILVFSDVATRIPEDSLRIMASRFTDGRTGAVSSEDRFISRDGRVVGEGAYVRYEMWLRRLESSRAGLVGLSGSFFAARKEICEKWDIYSPSDFNTALNCARMKMKAISCPDVLGIYMDVSDPMQEYRRKIRTVVRGITAISRHPEVLNPFRMGLFAFQVFSHKIMRWSVPWFMLALAITNAMLIGHGVIYHSALVIQLLFYTLAMLGWISAWLRRYPLVSIAFFFVQTNLALAQATIYFLSGKRMMIWQPSRR